MTKKKKSGITYTNAELGELDMIHWELVNKHGLSYAENGALWQRLYGPVAETAAFLVLRIADDVFSKNRQPVTQEECHNFFKRIGAHIATYIDELNVDFFSQMAVLLKARKAGRPLGSLTHNELGIRRPRGRKPTRSSLSRAFPLALWGATKRRSRGNSSEEEFTRLKITRTELLALIRREQDKAGLSEPPPISEAELSRWIGRYNFGRFMAEQPIARKPKKKG